MKAETSFHPSGATESAPSDPAHVGHLVVCEMTADRLEALATQIRCFAHADRDENLALGMLKAVQDNVRGLQGFNTMVVQQLAELSVTGSGLKPQDAFRSVGRLSDGDAKRAAKRADLASALPVLGAAVAEGKALTDNIDTVAATRHKLRHHAEWLAAFDTKDRLLAYNACKLTPEAFRKWLKRRVDALCDDGLTETRTEQAASTFTSWIGRDGRTKFMGDYDPIRGEMITDAVQAQTGSLAARKKQAGEAFHTDAHLAAEAFYELITAKTSGVGRAKIHVLVDLDTLRTAKHDRDSGGDRAGSGGVRETFAGTQIPPELLDQWLCDADLAYLLMDNGGRPLRVGRDKRTATTAQRAALRAMYPTCFWCETPFGHCQMHHIIPWEDGGQTNLDNLIPVCSVHHDQIHGGKWAINLLPDRKLQIRRPNGQLWKTIDLPSATPTRKRNTARKHRNVVKTRPPTQHRRPDHN